ncbi:uncharacterized protein C8Q71DRAFT_69524 [Rhodofomes roseus]|uniref:Zn(2)-C6 fungal-type domain-containing protein n=1 Tax=Rhodofomes roseus TaxID=34475 RepID=A0ABQ8KF89_9APHY|nr:uncharacterized protein C8Q71DRAFT_69524 [Rhodofomes roseus]KAH9836168.1 hypothetical protein C8Q71DRAFT_69524 [Rhodofomes roseus]
MSRPQEQKSSPRQGSAEREKSSSSSSVPPPQRPSGACVQCKALKIRCEFIPEEDTCVRCRASGTECVSRGRKKRRAAPTQEELQQRSQSQDLQIQSLLRRLDETKARSKVLHCLAQAQAEADSMSRRSHETYANVSRGRPTAYPGAPSNPGLLGQANYADRFANYASSSNQPAILQSGLFGPLEITALFDLYFDRVHASFAILDPEIHTPQYLMSKSPLLFTMILAIATRHWQPRPKLHQLAMAYACEAVTQALIDSCHAIETCQAYILLTVYPAPFQRWFENRSWLLIGASIRMAQHLQLDYPPPPEVPERERLNRIRTWFFIMVVDTSHCIQRGRTPARSRSDFTNQIFDLWYRCSTLNLSYDIYIVAYLDSMRLAIQLLEAVQPDRSNPDLWEEPDVLALVREYDYKITQRYNHWQQRLTEQHNPADWRVKAERDTRLTLNTCLQRLVVLGAGVHWCLKKGVALAPDIFDSSVQIAKTTLRIHIDQLYPNGHLRYAIEPQFLYVTYTAAFLLKLLDPRFATLVDRALRDSILTDVHSLIRVWASADVALDKQHAPYIYSRFLSSLLSKYLEAQNAGPDASVHAPLDFSWPQGPRSDSPQGYDVGPMGYQTVFDADPAQFVEASQGGDAFAFQNFVTNVKTAQAGWQMSEPQPLTSFHEPSWQAGSWCEDLQQLGAAAWDHPAGANTLYERTVLSG